MDAPLSIVSPADGQDFSLEAADRLVVSIEDSSFLSGGEGRRIALVLDDERVRYVARGDTPLRLRELTSPGTGVGAGAHRLLALAVTESGLLPAPGGSNGVAVARFTVGEVPASPRPVKPEIVYVEPQGTFNGEESASKARLDFYVLGNGHDLGGLALEVGVRSSKGARTVRLEALRPHAITGLESGDYDFELRLLDVTRTGSSQISRAGRTITVNLDAPVPAPSATAPAVRPSTAPPAR